MKTLIVYVSIHHNNTKKIAEAIGKELKAKLCKPFEIKNIEKYDLVGFGSGIYNWRHHKSLLAWVDKFPKQKNKKAFIFSTYGLGSWRFYHKTLRQKLLNKGFNIVDEFSCKGYDSVGIYGLFGGINRGKPDKKDIVKAKKFAKKLIKKIKNGT